MKKERRDYILSQLEKNSLIKVSDLQKELGVTEMTIRRDLTQLEEEGLLIRVLGGAQKIPSVPSPNQSTILSLEHEERRKLNREKKEMIGKKAAELIKDNEVIFVSAGSTNEFIAQYLTAKNVKVITNCLYIFFLFDNLPNTETILIGGKYNSFIHSFLGTMTFEGIKNINFTKAFVGTNAVSNNKLYASNEEEGLLHKTILDNSIEKYILCDTTKFNTAAFFNFYDCNQLTAIITDDDTFENINEYQELCHLM